MPPSSRIIKHAEQITTEWAGGTTTQLAIYPPEASYAERSFKWRLSTATVKLPESCFTSLPGFQRILMILSGEIHLIHKDHHERNLQAFEQDCFDGSWNTTSFGCAIDFNLMMAEGVDGYVTALALLPNSKKEISLGNQQQKNKQRISAAFYAYNGSVEICATGVTHVLEEKDMLLLHDLPATEQSTLSFHSRGASVVQVIQAVIHY